MPAPDSSAKGIESLQLELMHKPFVLLDNVDTEVKWLNDFLCTYATGAEPSKRKLYTDTAQVSTPYRGRLLLTSRRPTFRRPETASRTIPLRFEPIGPSERKTEGELLTPVIQGRGLLWGALLEAIGRLQDRFLDLHPPAPTLRLADFEQFGWLVAAVFDEKPAWEAMVPRLRLAQAGFALQDEPLVPALRQLLQDGDVSEQRTSELFKQVQKAAGALGTWDIPSDAAAFTKYVNEHRESLEIVLDVKIKDRTLNGYTLIQIVRGPSWVAQGDRGDRVSDFSVTAKDCE